MVTRLVVGTDASSDLRRGARGAQPAPAPRPPEEPRNFFDVYKQRLYALRTGCLITVLSFSGAVRRASLR